MGLGLVLRWVATLEPWVEGIFQLSLSDVRRVPTAPGVEPGTSFAEVPGIELRHSKELPAGLFLRRCGPPPRAPANARPGFALGFVPPVVIRFFGNNFGSALFTWGERRVCLQTNHTKPPPAGFVWWCDAAISRYHHKKTCLSYVFPRTAKIRKWRHFR